MKLVVFVLTAAVLAVTATSSVNNCITGCNCKLDKLEIKLQIKGCQHPISLTNNTLARYSKVIALHMENVIIKSFDESALQLLTDLEDLSLQDCRIEKVHPSAFDLENLHMLNFTNVKFAELPSFVSHNLEEITFNRCGLEQMPNFDNMPNLAYINLDSNAIVNVSARVFEKLKSLEELTLVNNSIVNLPTNVFDSNIDLTSLTLDNNPLEYFSVSTMNSLEYISLKNCKISVFDRSSSKQLGLVTYLDLSHNNISILPLDAFNGMKSLNYLYISHNHLVELDDDIFIDNTQLDRIILDHNNFKKLPKFQSFEKTFRTSFFSCNHCGLKTVNNVFDNMKSLLTLNLKNNRISNIENAFTEIRKLQHLDLSNNLMSAIGTNAFAKRNHIETLNLSENPLKPLDPVVISNFGDLKKLDISNSNLTKIWSNHNSKLSNLERLLVAKNALTTVNTEDLKILPKLKLIDLNGNPIRCSKELHDIIAYLTKNNIYPLEGAPILQTHEALLLSDPEISRSFDLKSAWQRLAINSCFTEAGGMKVYEYDDNKVKYEIEKDLKTDSETSSSYDESYEDSEEYNYDNVDEIIVKPNYDDNENLNVARASYILSITSVFALTALVVLSVAVAITLLVLRRNTAYVNNGSLPRLKIPKWHSSSLQKKHCGSVYRPLSEEHITTINYQFHPTPVHNNTQP